MCGSTCNHPYIRDEGRALIRIVIFWAGVHSRVTWYSTSLFYHPFQASFAQECYTYWEHQCVTSTLASAPYLF